MEIGQTVKEIGKRKIAVLIIISVISISALVLISTDKNTEEDKKQFVIEGGKISGPVDIGRTRIKVVEGEVEEKWVKIENGELNPEKLNVPENSDVYFHNLDKKEYTINFLGQRKRAYLTFNQSYHLNFNSGGVYSYRVYNDSWEVEGKIVVEA